MPDREKEQLRIEPWNYDLQEARRRLKTAERISHLKKLIETVMTECSEDEKESIYYDILFIKILSDYGFVKLQNSINLNTGEFLAATDLINKKYNNILSPSFRNLNEDTIFKILRELQRFDFSDLDIGHDQKKGMVILDNDLEQIIFGKKYGVRSIEHKFFECLGINKKSHIYCDAMEMELFSFLFFSRTIPEEIITPNAGNNIKKAVIFGLMYKFISKFDFIFNIVRISPEINISNTDILIIKDETSLGNNSLETDENLKILIKDIGNCYLSDEALNRILTKFGVIFNIDYHTFNSFGEVVRKNGLIAQKYFNHRSGLLNALDKLKLKTLEEKKSRNLSKNILSVTINHINEHSIDGYYYFGGLKKEDIQSKQIDAIKIDSVDKLYVQDRLTLEEIDTLYDFLRYDDIEALQKLSKYHSSQISFDLRNNNFYNGAFELNTPVKQDIFSNSVIHPFYYRKCFNELKRIVEDERHNITDEIIETIIFGKEYSELIEYKDELFLNKNDYIPVVDSETIRFGNFPDITKVNFALRKSVSFIGASAIKEDDILISFKIPDNENRVKIAWAIAPKVLDGALPGKNTIALRPDSISVTSFQFIEFLNLLSSSGMLNQLSELLNPVFLEGNFESFTGVFIKSYFLKLPFPYKIKQCFEATSWIKKKVCDTYFGISSHENHDINELFQSIMKGTDTDKGSGCYPAASLWQKAYINLLWEYNKKPEQIFMISDYHAINYRDIMLKYFSSLDIFVEDIVFKGKNLKNIIKDCLNNRIKNITTTSTVIPGFFKNSIFIIFCNNVSMLNYYYENIKNLTAIKSVYLVYTKESKTEEIFDEEYDKIIKFFEEKQIELIDRIKINDIKQFLRNPFHIEKKFLSSLLNYKELTITEHNCSKIFTQLSNILKEYADHIISHHSYYDQSAFFFLESNHFANKAMELQIEENKILAKKAEWESVIDQLAHSLNTNIGAARNSIHMLSESLNEKTKQDLANKSDKYLMEVADLVELTLDSLKVDVAKRATTRSLADIVFEQINVIKEGIDTLRFSSNFHKMNVKNMIPILELDSTIMLFTYARAAGLIIKDLLKNAYTNTNKEKPFVKIKSFLVDDETCILSIENNIAMSEEWQKRINDDYDSDVIKGSKSAAVGIKIVKNWNVKLNWKMNVAVDEGNDTTITTLTIPIKWKN